MTDLLIDTAERVMTITFNRVDKKNSFISAMAGGLCKNLRKWP